MARLVLNKPDELPQMAVAIAAHVDACRAARRNTATEGHRVLAHVDELITRIRTAVAQAEVEMAAQPLDSDARVVALAHVRKLRTRMSAALTERRRLQHALEEWGRASASSLRGIEECGDSSINSLNRTFTSQENARESFRAAMTRLRVGGIIPPFVGGWRGSGGLSDGIDLNTGSKPVRSDDFVGPGGEILVPLSSIDREETHVTGPQHFSNGKVSLVTMRAGLGRLEASVLPAVRNGATFEDMRELDRRYGLEQSESSHVRVYEAFFGDGAIELSDVKNGTYELRKGHHRVYAALTLGINELPARIRRAD